MPYARQTRTGHIEAHLPVPRGQALRGTPPALHTGRHHHARTGTEEIRVLHGRRPPNRLQGGRARGGKEAVLLPLGAGAALPGPPQGPLDGPQFLGSPNDSAT